MAVDVARFVKSSLATQEIAILFYVLEFVYR